MPLWGRSDGNIKVTFRKSAHWSLKRLLSPFGGPVLWDGPTARCLELVLQDALLGLKADSKNPYKVACLTMSAR